jgi:hypothetical protein
MRNKNSNLSKTRLMSSRQCLKRLYLEVHRPELAIVSAQTRAAFAGGNQVGDVARDIYGAPGSVLIPLEGGLSHALRKTTRLLDRGPDVPIFEATLAFGGVLVRLDILLPEGDGWRIVEVKSSTSQKAEHVADCAVQSWVFQGLGYRQTGIALAHVDNSFLYEGQGDYRGLLKENDLSDDVAALMPQVPDWVRAAKRAASGEQPAVSVGAQCNQPYACPFIDHCWPGGPHPVQTLPRASKTKLRQWIADGICDLRDVPTNELSESQQRVQRITSSGKAELLPAAREFVETLDFPRYFLDFETIAPPVPRWAGTRPYEVLPFQWSCHFEQGAGSDAEHAEFLDLTGDPPMRRLAESLLRVLGKGGPVLCYSAYERTVIERLRARFPDLDAALGAIVKRLVDLKPVAERN